MRLADRVVCRPHVKDDAAIFEQHGPWMIGEIGFDRLRQLRGRGRFGPRAPSDMLLSMGCFAGVHGLLPALSGAQAGDVGRVVARVPFVEREVRGQSHPPSFRMIEAAIEILFRHRLEKSNHALMQSGDENE